MAIPKGSPRLYSYIRFSTKEQQKGDSYRRQLDAAKLYAEKHGLELDGTISMRDEGLSGYKGDNIEKGALGDFLELLDKGHIPTKSVLLIESLDRLSRQDPYTAFKLVQQIIDGGVKIVDLSYGQEREYSVDKIRKNADILQTLFGELRRAHNESEMKSRRLSNAWSNKRKDINNKKLTSRCPKWLQLNKSRTQFEPIKKGVEVIQRIYTMKLDGMGKEAIAKELNESKAWTPDGSNGWRGSYIQKILTTSAVIGEYQPHKMINGKRVPTGDPMRLPPSFGPLIGHFKVEPGVRVCASLEAVRRSRCGA